MGSGARRNGPAGPWVRLRAGIPYEPVVEMLRDALGAPGLAGTAPEWLTEVTRLIPELKERFPALPGAGNARPIPPRAGVSSRVSPSSMLALAAERPVVISLDDLQWCDSDSCNLLRFLVRRTEQAPVFWLGTLSVGDLERDAPAARLCRVLRAKGTPASSPWDR